MINIPKLIREVAKEKKIKILFAVESGSRAWRLDSSNSDFDVRFVFVRPVKDYISINASGDVLTAHFDKNGNKVGQEGCFIDMCGFDVFKFSRMLSSSNPTVIEWLSSDIEYYGKKNKAWVDYAKNQFKPISLYFHYKSMCKQNYLKYLKSGNEVTYKKYLYAMRGLVNSKWIINNEGLPPIQFPETIKKVKGVPVYVLQRLLDIIKIKKVGKEKEVIQKIPQIDYEIENFLKDDSEAPKNKQLATTLDLDLELRKIVLNDEEEQKDDKN